VPLQGCLFLLLYQGVALGFLVADLRPAGNQKPITSTSYEHERELDYEHEHDEERKGGELR
jgi:hypothetical protein